MTFGAGNTALAGLVWRSPRVQPRNRRALLPTPPPAWCRQARHGHGITQGTHGLRCADAMSKAPPRSRRQLIIDKVLLADQPAWNFSRVDGRAARARKLG